MKSEHIEIRFVEDRVEVVAEISTDETERILRVNNVLASDGDSG